MQAKINRAEGKTEMPGMESTYLKRQDKVYYKNSCSWGHTGEAKTQEGLQIYLVILQSCSFL